MTQRPYSTASAMLVCGMVLVTGGPLSSPDVSATTTARVIVCLGVAAESGCATAEAVNGTAGAEVISGLGGADVINGCGGSERICDGVPGGTIRPEPGNDQVLGNDDDTIDGSEVCDELFGRGRNRMLTASAGTGTVTSGLGTSACSGETMASHERLSGTTTTVVPGGPLDVVLFPGEDWQRAVDANPGGTTFVVRAGTHRMQSVIPRSGDSFVGEPGAVMTGARLLTSWVREGGVWYVTGQAQQGPVAPAGWCEVGYEGCRYPEDLFFDDQILRHVRSRGELAPGSWFFDYDADTVWLADDPAGHVVEIGVTRYAFTGFADDVTIRGLVVEHYASDVVGGAIRTLNGSGWTIENNEVRHNHSAGVKAGDHDRVVGNNLHHNGAYGLAIWMGEDTLVEGNVIAYNNIAGFSPSWDAGGTKFTRTVGLIVRDNWVHHNNGNGFWSDGNNYRTLYENNIVADNSRDGIEHEISYDAVIRSNTVERNGRFGIYILDSPNVEVYGNTVRGNAARAITGVYDPSRGSGDRGPWELRNLYVHDNTIDMVAGGHTGIWNQDVDDDVYDSWGNRFANNHYRLGSNPQYYFWQGAYRSTAQWIAYGNDTTGTWQ